MNLAGKKESRRLQNIMTKQNTKILAFGGVLLLGFLTSCCEPNPKDMDKIGAARDCAPAQSAAIAVPGGSFAMGAHPE